MSGEALSFAVTDDPSPAGVKQIEAALMAFNAERAAPYDIRPLHVFLRDADGKLIGGLTGYTNWRWLYVDCLWLPENLRARNWGARLLEAAETEARNRGCLHAHLYSYEFQAPGFYQRLGYSVYGALEDYPPGSRRVLLRKEL